jgi:hypothetical protein
MNETIRIHLHFGFGVHALACSAQSETLPQRASLHLINTFASARWARLPALPPSPPCRAGVAGMPRRSLGGGGREGRAGGEEARSEQQSTSLNQIMKPNRKDSRGSEPREAFGVREACFRFRQFLLKCEI